MSAPNLEHIGTVVARVLARLERVERGLSNAVVGVKGTNVSVPRAVLEHHRHAVAESCNELRTAEAGAPTRAVPERVKHMVLLAAWSEARGGFVCARCSAVVTDRSDMHVDHITPLARGGSNDRTNLQALCSSCNLTKGARPA